LTPDKDPEGTGSPTSPRSLAARADQYRNEVEKVVRTVGEHPQYELKRSVELSALSKKIEFVKDIQAIATSPIDFEKYLVIGADEATRAFVPVPNLADFDEANLRQVFEKYLQPVPQFQVFILKTSDGIPFVLLVIGKQRTRRILARVNVVNPDDLAPRLILREGDLWTKGDSTGKRLARPEDWDGVYEEVVERESEARTRRRTDQVMQQVIAQERLRATSGSVSTIPAYLSDDEFRAFVEGVCVEEDSKRLGLLLERLRDDLIEGWHSVRAYDEESIYSDPQAIIAIRAGSLKYRDDNFLPAMQRLTLLGLQIVKSGGSIRMFELTMELIRNTYNVSSELSGLRLATPRGSRSQHLGEHISHTTPALHCLLAVHIIGAYITGRRRFAYIPSIMNQPVVVAGLDPGVEAKSVLLAMWPLHCVWGEPLELKTRSGRIDLCKSKIMNDPVFSKLFGSESAALKGLMQFDYLIEWNSYLALGERTPQAVREYMRTRNPNVDFSFRTSLVAFELKYLAPLAVELFGSLRTGTSELLSQTLLDASVMPVLGKDTVSVFLECLRATEDDHERWMSEMHRFSFLSPWPEQLGNALKALPPRANRR
jgi:hypothetical protein